MGTKGHALTEIGKLCVRCGADKPLADFYKAKGKAGGRYAHCKTCQDLSNRRWREANPEYNRRYSIKSRYGIDFDAVFEAQGRCCALCRADSPRGMNKKWHVDHDHSCCPGSKTCGRCVRGIVCGNCNSGLGQFGDNPALLRAAADYLDSAALIREV